ncbi:MAG TPA: L,D-transpeptidase family protein [Verrucomicrobiales bacterium]|nr:L,D-transpeptidase family protein [Verrucomicrobiales bacterium]
MLRPLFRVILALACFVLTSCQILPPPSHGVSRWVSSLQPDSWKSVSYWDDDGSPGKPWMKVDLSRQIATFYRGDHKIGVAAISSGDERHRTPSGEYRILEKLEEKYSGSYGHIENAEGKVVNADATPRTRVPPGCKYCPAPMPYWMRLTWYGIGMHQGFLPGYAASHGCIRMDKAVVQKFFHASHVGMRVKVVGGD